MELFNVYTASGYHLPQYGQLSEFDARKLLSDVASEQLEIWPSAICECWINLCAPSISRKGSMRTVYKLKPVRPCVNCEAQS